MFYSTGHFLSGLEPLEAGFECPGEVLVPLSVTELVIQDLQPLIHFVHQAPNVTTEK